MNNSTKKILSDGIKMLLDKQVIYNRCTGLVDPDVVEWINRAAVAAGIRVEVDISVVSPKGVPTPSKKA